MPFTIGQLSEAADVGVNGLPGCVGEKLFTLPEQGFVEPAHDGRSFVVIVPEPAPADASITLVKNWRATIEPSD